MTDGKNHSISGQRELKSPEWEKRSGVGMWMKGRDESEKRGVERSLKGEAPEDKSHWLGVRLESIKREGFLGLLLVLGKRGLMLISIKISLLN